MGWSWGEEVDEEAEEVDDETEEVADVVEEGDDGTRLGAWWEWGALALGRELRTLLILITLIIFVFFLAPRAGEGLVIFYQKNPRPLFTPFFSFKNGGAAA